MNENEATTPPVDHTTISEPKITVNVEAISAWLIALRSGNFRQGIGYLCQVIDDDGDESQSDCYCPLGVACEVAVTLGVIPEPKLIAASDDSKTKLKRYGAQGTVVYLPDEVQRWLGITDFDTRIQAEVDGLRGGWLSLAMLNDGGKISLADAADLIEKTYLTVVPTQGNDGQTDEEDE